ncbi:MAG: class I SAM-dependent methyltransferase [Crocinitomicaceae bacterium]
MSIENLAKGIVKGENGIYQSKSKSIISYPEEGNSDFMQIEENSFWFRHRNNLIAECVQKYSPKDLFFDIGGGNGFVSKRLQEEGVDVVLVEPGESGAINAKSRGVENVLCSTLEDALFSENSIGSVGLFDVVEHIEDDLSFMQNIHSFMKSGSHVYITVPAYNFCWSNEDDDAGHYRRYTVGDMKELLLKSGFEITFATYIFSILPFPVYIFRTIPSKLGLNKNSNDLEKHQNEHKDKTGFVNNMLQKIWDWELSRIKNEKSISMGGSCFVIAKKK